MKLVCGLRTTTTTTAQLLHSYSLIRLLVFSAFMKFFDLFSFLSTLWGTDSHHSSTILDHLFKTTRLVTIIINLYHSTTITILGIKGM